MTDNFNNLFIAKKDINYISDHHKVKITKGTIVTAALGGYFYGNTEKEAIGNVTSVNSKKISGYNVRTDKDNYIEVEDKTWAETLKTTKLLENWSRKDTKFKEAANKLDISEVKRLINMKMLILEIIQYTIKI